MEQRQPVGSRFVRDAVITCAAVVLAVLALDDITTDSALSFPIERTALAGSAVWFFVVAWRLWRRGQRVLGAVSFGLVTIGALAQPASPTLAAKCTGQRRSPGRSRRLAVGPHIHRVDRIQSPITAARSGRVPNYRLSVVHVHHGRGHSRGVGGGGVSRVHAVWITSALFVAVHINHGIGALLVMAPGLFIVSMLYGTLAR